MNLVRLEKFARAKSPLSRLERTLEKLGAKSFGALLLMIGALGIGGGYALADLIASPGVLFTRANYDYAPSVINEGSLQKYWWCGYGPAPAHPGRPNFADTIYYRAYDGSTGTWSAIQQVLTPTSGTWDAKHTCDPSVVKGNFAYNGANYAYAMYYTATDTDTNNRVGVAFSNNGTTWVKRPTPVIFPRNATQAQTSYGAGQSATYNGNGAAGIWMFHTDTTGNALDGNGISQTRILLRYASDGINFGAPTLVSAAGLPITYMSNSDFAFDNTVSPARWYAAIPMLGRAGDRETYRIGLYRMPNSDIMNGTGTWELVANIDSNLTGAYLNHSPGIVRDIYGSVSGLPSVQVVHSRGDNDPNAWDLAYAKWNPSPQTTPFKRYWNPTFGDHWVTTGNVKAGWNMESTLGHLPVSPKAGTQALYGCQAGNDRFVSLDANCENQTVLGVNGYIYTLPPAGIATTPLYRCFAANNFVSQYSSCEGSSFAGLLGYAPTSPVN